MAIFQVRGYDDFSGEPELVSEYRVNDNLCTAEQIGALIIDMLTANDGSTGITHIRVNLESEE